MKVDTVEQYKVLEYINNNFESNRLNLELIDRYTIKATDVNRDEIIFYYDKLTNKIEYKDVV